MTRHIMLRQSYLHSDNHTDPGTSLKHTERTQSSEIQEEMPPLAAQKSLPKEQNSNIAIVDTPQGDDRRRERPCSDDRDDYCSRERLKRHRTEMAGRVWIPEIWGQEKLLKDWADCSAFDSDLVPSGLTSARQALVEECRKANSGKFRIENPC